MNRLGDILRRGWRRASVWALLLTFVFLLLPEELWARRGGRISVGRSSSFSRSHSYSSRAKSWGSSRPKNVTPRMGTRSASRPPTTRSYGVDSAVLNRARTQGTVFQSRSEAQRAFERDNASKFPSTFSREPSSRPSYIPQTTTVDGQSYDVRYNPQYGSYGFMRDGGWVGYNALRDVAMLSLLMRQNSYVYPQAQTSSSSDDDGEDDGSMWAWILGPGSGLVILLLVLGAWAMIPRKRNAQRYYAGAPPPSGVGRGGWPPPGAPSSLQPDNRKEQSMRSALDLRSPDFWRSVRPGSTVVLKDEQTLADMIESGEALATGRDYNVEEIWRVKESRDVAEWQFFRIRSPHDEDATWLMVKSAGDELSAGVYFEADGFTPGNRDELLQQEMFWVFAEPRDPNNYRVLDLHFAQHLYFNVDLNGEAREAEFAKMGNLEFHGKATADPAPGNLGFSDSTRMMGTVVEYLTTMPVPNPKVVFLETGVPNERGGLIRMLQGADIPVGDIEVLAVGQDGSAPPPRW